MRGTGHIIAFFATEFLNFGVMVLNQAFILIYRLILHFFFHIRLVCSPLKKTLTSDNLFKHHCQSMYLLRGETHVQANI